VRSNWRHDPVRARRKQVVAGKSKRIGSTSRLMPQEDDDLAGGEQTLKLATGTLRDGSGSAVLGTLALAVAVGLLVGRRLADHCTVRRTL
jgi:hypothetical protein